MREHAEPSLGAVYRMDSMSLDGATGSPVTEIRYRRRLAMPYLMRLL